MRHPVFAASLLFAVILTATGAFGTFRMVLPVRFACWTLLTFSAAASLIATSRIRDVTWKRAWPTSVVMVAAAAVPPTIVAAAAAGLLLPGAMSLGRVLGFYPAALVLTLLLLALFRLTATRDVIVEVGPATTPDDSVPVSIASRLPPRLTRSRLLAVEAQDHYLRVATRDGEALVHMRFADAVAALDESDGIRVHRSWWVARTAIHTMKFASGRGELTLVDGTVVPVSRRFAPQAKKLARRPKP